MFSFKVFDTNILTDETFLLFLKHQVKGVFDNLFCIHNSDYNNCLVCVREFIEHSQYKNYFESLYYWFKKVNSDQLNKNETLQINDHQIYIFYPVDVIKCFKFIYTCLTFEQASYFCSPWLDGFFIPNFNSCNHIRLYDIFKGLCEYGYYETLQWLISLPIFDKIDVHTNDEEAFRYACEKGHINVVNLLLKLEGNQRIDVHAIDECAFRWACHRNHIHIINLLLNLKGDRYIDVHTKNEKAFLWACLHGKIEIVKLLLKLEGDRKINVNILNESAFMYACGGGHIEIVKLLLELEGNQKFNIHNSGDRAFNIACKYNHKEIMNLLSKLNKEKT